MSLDTEAPSETGGGENPTDQPLPPYPPELGRPTLHIVRAMRDTLGFGERAYAASDLYRTRLLGQGDIYHFAHPDHLKRVLVTDRDKFRKSADFRIAFGEGLLTVEGAEWQAQRKALQPLFTRDSVAGYADGMVEQIVRRSEGWTDGDRLDLQAEFTRMTLDVLFATVLGRELTLDGDERLRTAAEDLHEWFVRTSYLLPPWVPTPSRRRFRQAKAALRDEAGRLLEERADDPPANPGEADDLLSLLVALREVGGADAAMLTDDRLRDQMVTIIFAGHDTTTTSLSFAFWALANHPEVREQFHAEIDDLDADPSVDDIRNLDYTDKVLTESLRLYPPVYALPRRTNEELVVDGYRIPANETVALPIRNIQRDERFFDDPTTFRPERWTQELRRELHDFAYAPFGGGPRICIGREFALLEAKLALVHIGREYALEWAGTNEPDGEPPTSPEMTLRMPPGQEFVVRER